MKTDWQWVKTSTNKQRCPVFCLAWAPEGVTRCITGNSSGEFTLWKDGAFNFVTILQVKRTRILRKSRLGSFCLFAIFDFSIFSLYHFLLFPIFCFVGFCHFVVLGARFDIGANPGVWATHAKAATGGICLKRMCILNFRERVGDYDIRGGNVSGIRMRMVHHRFCVAIAHSASLREKADAKPNSRMAF